MYENKNEQITSKIVVKGLLRNTSPLIIGTGDKYEEMNILIQRNHKGNPFIPGTTLAGVLRHHFIDYFKNEEFADDFDDYFWGYSKKDEKNNHKGAQSSLIVSDASLESDIVSDNSVESKITSDTNMKSDLKIEIRDGIRIDNKTGMVKNKGKYDYETLAPGCEFEFKFELNIRETFCKNGFEKILNTLLDELKNNNISLGSMTTKGFGEIEIVNSDIYKFDFSKPKDVINWLKYGYSQNKKDNITEEKFKKIQKDLILEAHFRLKTSLIIRAYSGELKAPDASHIQSNGASVIPGTSLKGAIRSRAVRIINTLKIKEQFIKDLMGFADDENKSDEKIKSRVIIKEHRINKDDIFSLVQNRIKIDRFTGGTIKTALFDLMPVWPKTDEDVLVLNLRVKNCSESEAGLIMLVLKDLWVGDLPIGGEKNVGRGVFSGHSAKINYCGKEYSLSQQGEKLEIGRKDEIDGKDEMENWVKQLLKVEVA